MSAEASKQPLLYALSILSASGLVHQTQPIRSVPLLPTSWVNCPADVELTNTEICYYFANRIRGLRKNIFTPTR